MLSVHEQKIWASYGHVGNTDECSVAFGKRVLGEDILRNREKPKAVPSVLEESETQLNLSVSTKSSKTCGSAMLQLFH